MYDKRIITTLFEINHVPVERPNLNQGDKQE